tara:strand:- start:1964 stop:2365 length:402 start_codon:yes stop_codon:yes gene_type:complete
MGIFIVTATSTDDDYKRPYVSSETAMATSREDAVVRAVEFYLERLDGGYSFDYHSPSGFNQIIEKHRNSPQSLFSALYDYFESNPEGMFTGEFVPETLSVTISESDHAPLDTKPILSMVDEITRYIKEELEEG